MASRWATVGELARWLGLIDHVTVGVRQSYARWDGRGVLAMLSGDTIALSARISHLANTGEVVHGASGIQGAVAVARRGTHHDPQIVDAVLNDPGPRFALATTPSMRFSPPTQRWPPLPEAELDVVLEAIADFRGLRCSYFAGHARGTADFVSAAAAVTAIPEQRATMARPAALIQDLGRVGVPADVWVPRGGYQQATESGCGCIRTLSSAPSADRSRCGGSDSSRGTITSRWTAPVTTCTIAPNIGVCRLTPLIRASGAVARSAGRCALTAQPGQHGGLAYFGQGNGQQTLRPFHVLE